MPYVFRYAETPLQKKLRDYDLLGHSTPQHYPTALYLYKKRSMHGIAEYFDLYARDQSHGSQPTLEPVARIHGNEPYPPTCLHDC